MGLSDLLAHAAGRRVHVLVAEVPGGFRARVAIEGELAARGWIEAQSPAGADVLVVCGAPTPPLAERLEAVFDQLPGPRTRVDVRDPDRAGVALDDAWARLLDLPRQSADARERVPSDKRDADHDAMDDGDMDHGDMDHGGMEMAPAGIPLAEGSEDRDGLEMDVLHLPLGPVLPRWPAGLVVRCVLHGDVVADADVDADADAEVEPALQPADGWANSRAEAAALRLDAVGCVLALAGWERGAERSRRIRDLCLVADDAALPDIAGFRGRLERAHLVRWMLRDLGVIDARDLPVGLADRLGGDVQDRLLGLLDDARGLLGGSTPAPYDARGLLPGTLRGLELASVRLVVASLGPFLGPGREPARA